MKVSRASIKTEGLLGDKYVEISFGSPKAEAIGDDATIGSETQKDVSEQAQELTDEARAGIAAFRDNMEATISSSADFSKDADTVTPRNWPSTPSLGSHAQTYQGI